jgi:hypothetical protein
MVTPRFALFCSNASFLTEYSIVDRVTGRVGEKIAQNVAQPIFCQNKSTTYFVGKKFEPSLNVM